MSAPTPQIARLDADLQALSDRRQQAADCETLRAAREASQSESDRIAYALAMVLVTHPGCCTRNAGGQS
ncbi:hypothetical protein [Streptomyces lavendulae]|uniref:hypothetical protein n=1 Tax=Streptomyces lavendulae TaxID=1914 RepID=UPI0031F1956A